MSSNARKDIHNSEVPLLCISCEARHRGICGALTPTELIELSKQTSKHSFEAGRPISADGESIHRYSNILHGVVKLAKLTSDGRQQIVGLQFAPDFLGRPFQARSDYDVEAATEVQVCSFPKDSLDRLTKLNPELEHRLHAQTLKELDEARDWMLALGRKSAAERVASFLFFIAQHIHPEKNETGGGVHFDIPLSRSDMADFLGLTIETVSRQMTKLRQGHVIEIINNRTISVADMAKLKSVSETNIN